MECFFGWGKNLETGYWPSVAMNANEDIVMAHITSAPQLAYRFGTVKRATVEWGPNQNYDEGREPSIALSATHVLTVHRGVDDDRTFYRLGTFANGTINSVDDGKYDEGVRPHVAINDNGAIVEVHHAEEKNRVWYNIGRIEDDKVRWKAKSDFADGGSPAVAINNFGEMIVAYVRDGDVYYRIGSTSGTEITFYDEHKVAHRAGDPSVAVTDAGRYVISYTRSDGGHLIQRLGTKEGTSVSWGSGKDYDIGMLSTVAAQGWLAIQIHLIPVTDEERFSTSLITDRSSWMADRAVPFGDMPLRELTLPGSHDAGMYKTFDHVSNTWAKNQNQHIDTQLMWGQRWFDLRVLYWSTVSDLYIHHDGTLGPKLSQVLDQVAAFMKRGGRELVILKFSHFQEMDGDRYRDFVKEVKDRLGDWLYVGPLPPGKRLADLTLNDYGARVLVVVDRGWAQDYPEPGFWVYRDATGPQAGDAAEGDLRVFDRYSNTQNYNTMKSEQTKYFQEYDGLCDDAAKSPCDLFLLSWTLTPGGLTGVKSLARQSNPNLADEVAYLPVRNEFGKVMNVVYVDYAEYARPSDVSITQNYEQSPANG